MLRSYSSELAGASARARLAGATTSERRRSGWADPSRTSHAVASVRPARYGRPWMSPSTVSRTASGIATAAWSLTRCSSGTPPTSEIGRQPTEDSDERDRGPALQRLEHLADRVPDERANQVQRQPAAAAAGTARRPRRSPRTPRAPARRFADPDRSAPAPARSAATARRGRAPRGRAAAHRAGRCPTDASR